LVLAAVLVTIGWRSVFLWLAAFYLVALPLLLAAIPGDKAAKAHAAQGAAADAFAARMRPILAELGDMSATAKAKALNARGVKTARGQKWTSMQVIRIMRRTPEMENLK
jgi:hypothetical protein